MDYTIDDRPLTLDPKNEKMVFCIVAEKQGKNGNVKKTIALKVAGGAHTDEQVTRLVQETEGSNVTINIVMKPDCKVIDDEVKFMKIVKKMMK